MPSDLVRKNNYFIHRRLALDPSYRLLRSPARDVQGILSLWSLCSHEKRVSKQNKYGNFSKAVPLDPQSQAMTAFRFERSEKKFGGPAVNLGATVVVANPELQSNRMPEPLTRPEAARHVDPGDPFSFGFCRIGYVAGARGLNGEVTIHLDSTFGIPFCAKDSVLFVRRPNRCAPRPLRLVSARVHRHGHPSAVKVFGIFENVQSRGLAQAFKGYEVFVKNSDRYKQVNKDCWEQGTPEEDFLIRDLVGLKCLLLAPEAPTTPSTTAYTYTGALQWSAGRGIVRSGQMDRPRDRPPPQIVGRVVGVVTPEQICGGDRSAENVMHALLEVEKCGSNDRFMVPFVGAMVSEVDLVGGSVQLSPRCATLLSLTYAFTTDRGKIRGALPSRLSH